MKQLINWICARLAEESTWRGIIVVASLAGAALNPELSEAIITTGGSLFGLILIIKKQSASKEAVAKAINVATAPNVLGIPRAIEIDPETLLPK